MGIGGARSLFVTGEVQKDLCYGDTVQQYVENEADESGAPAFAMQTVSLWYRVTEETLHSQRGCYGCHKFQPEAPAGAGFRLGKSADLRRWKPE